MRMRIISGRFKGRLINVPKSNLIRPTTDRVRETLFNLLNNQINFDGIRVLDLYAGSGSLGFECLSRGASEIHFVEKNFEIYKNLQANIESLSASNKCKIYKMEVLRFSHIKQHKNYDLILADPPFFKDDIYLVTKKLIKNNFLSDKGFIVTERSIQTKQKDTENFLVEPFKIIGDTCLYHLEGN